MQEKAREKIYVNYMVRKNKLYSVTWHDFVDLPPPPPYIKYNFK